MDLNKLSRNDLNQLQGELKTLQSDLSTIATAAEGMAEGDFEPQISLGADGTTIRARPVAGLSVDVLLVVHPRDLPIEIDTTPVGFPEAKAATSPAASAIAAEISPTEPAKSLRVGPLDEDERAVVLRRHARGERSSDIARALGRRPQTISLFLSTITRTSKRSSDRKHSDKPGQPAPSEGHGEQDPGEAATREVAPEQSAPVAGGADIEILGGDQGGLQRNSLAEHDPVQAESKGQPQAAAQLSAEAPSGFNVFERAVWTFLSRLAFPRGWDIEMDLDMIEAFGQGSKAAQVALDLGVDTKVVVDRHRLLTDMVRDDRGQILVDGMAMFVSALRAFVKAQRQGGAG